MKASVLLSLLPLALAAPTSTTSKRANGPAPLLRTQSSKLLKDKYIVKFNPGSTSVNIQDAMGLFEGEADHIYTAAGFKGFAATLNQTALGALLNHVDVRLGSPALEFCQLTYFLGRVR